MYGIIIAGIICGTVLTISIKAEFRINIHHSYDPIEQVAIDDTDMHRENDESELPESMDDMVSALNEFMGGTTDD
jgi:hypothetical protein